MNVRILLGPARQRMVALTHLLPKAVLGKYNQPEAIADEADDHDPNNIRRCAIKVKDLVILRDADILSTGLTIAVASKKNATDEDIKKMQLEMETAGNRCFSGKRSRMEMAKDMSLVKKTKAW